MGIEIRMVPENWQHPQDAQGHYRPLHNKSYQEALTEWNEGKELWTSYQHPDQIAFPEDTKEMSFEEYMGEPPAPEFYYGQKWEKGEENCFQVYENISEGTPISPVLGSLAEIEDWIVKNQMADPISAKKICQKFKDTM